MLITNYLIIPIGNIVLTCVIFFDPYYDVTNQPMETYVLFFMGNCIARIIEYFTMIKRTVLLDSYIYQQQRKDIEVAGLSNEELEKELEKQLKLQYDEKRADAAKYRAFTIKE